MAKETDQNETTPATENNAVAENIEAAETSIYETQLKLEDIFPHLSERLPQPLAEIWQTILSSPWLQAITVLTVFLLLAFIVRLFVIRLVVKLAWKTETDLDDQIVEHTRGPLFKTIVLIGIMVAFATLGLAIQWGRFLAPLLMTIIVFIWMRVGLRLSSIVFSSLSRNRKIFKSVNVGTEPLFVITSKLLCLVVASYMVLIIWGINPVGLLASAGIVGIAVGFAAKDTLANLFSGVFILADRPYKLGDYIVLDSGERGQVTHIGIRSTRILTRDDIELTVPNGIIGNSLVINESGGAATRMRLRLSVQCAYDADLDEVNRVLLEVPLNMEEVCEHPAPRVRVRGFADSGINVQLLCWIDNPEDKGRLSHLLYSRIHAAFADAGLEIPYPKRDIQIQGDVSEQSS